MRITLTIDDDIAARLKRVSRGGSLEDVTNRALRLGLQAMEARIADKPYATQSVRGRPKLMNLDNVAEVIERLD